MSSATTGEERADEIKDDFANEDGLSVFDAKDYDLFTDGFGAVKTSGSGGRIILPNERLAMLWRREFRVQFTDGGWRAVNSGRRQNRTQQMEHPFPYANAEIVVDASQRYPRFEAYETHEKMETPLEHYSEVEFFFGDMVYRVRMMTGDDSYGLAELKEDLRLFESMEFSVSDWEKCSQCNPEIY